MKSINYIFLFFLLITQTTICLHEKIFIATIPKTGTHLLRKIITLLTGNVGVGTNTSWLYITPERLNTIKPNQFLISHAPPIQSNVSLLEHHNYRGIFLYRDPRDQVVSLAYYLAKYKIGTIHKLPIQEIITKVISNYKVIDYLVVKIPYYPDINLTKLNNVKQHYDAYLPWKDHPAIYTTTFEKIVGPRGGGTEMEQLQEIKNIANHLGLLIDNEEAKKIAVQLFGSSDTFREGQIGSHKKHFTSRQKKLFKEIAGTLLIQLGYEQDFDW